MDIPSGIILQVPSPGLATRRGLTFWSCLRGTGLGWSRGKGWPRGTYPGDSLARELTCTFHSPLCPQHPTWGGL